LTSINSRPMTTPVNILILGHAMEYLLKGRTNPRGIAS
jgi:hypothetical protein